MSCRLIGLFLSAIVISVPTILTAAPPRLTVYTYDAFSSKWGPGSELKKIFQNECKCEIQFVSAADGTSLLSKLKLEGTKTKADVVVGLDSTLTHEARATKLFATIDQNATWDVPAPLEDQDLFQPVDFGWFSFMYDQRSSTSGKKSAIIIPKSFEELLNAPTLNRQIIIQDPRSSSAGLGLLLWFHARFGDQAGRKMQQFKQQVKLVGSGWSDSYSKFTRGEAPVVFSYTTSEIYHRQEEHIEHFKAMSFADGHYLQVEVAGIIQRTKVPDLAKKFLKFLAGPHAQAAIAKGNWMYPVTGGASAIPVAYAKMSKIEKTLYLPASTVSKNRKLWTDEWVQIFSKK